MRNTLKRSLKPISQGKGDEIKMKLSYYAVFEYAPDGINITFPDLPAVSCAMDEEKGVVMAAEALALCLHGMSPEDIPAPSRLEDIALRDDCKAFSITVELEILDGKLVSDGGLL